MWRRREDSKGPSSPASYPPNVTHPQSSPGSAVGSSSVAAPGERRTSANLDAGASAPVDNFRARSLENSLQAASPLSIISKGLVIAGEVSGAEDLQIDGQLRGSVRLAGARLLITPDGHVAGNIEAREVVVRGRLKGDVVAAERVLVGATGVWEGDSLSPRLVIEDGAVVNGKLEVSRPKAQLQPKKTAFDGANSDGRGAEEKHPDAIRTGHGAVQPAAVES